MGASESSSVQVTFNRPNVLYYADELISGNISLRNDAGELQLDSIYLELIGECGHATDERRRSFDRKGHECIEQYIKYHQIPFLNYRIAVVQPQNGQIILYRGQYSWPFELVVPANIPPSFISLRNSYPYIKYYARVVLDKPGYKPHAKQTFPLTIFPRVNLLYLPSAQQQIPFSTQNRKKTRLQGYLVRSGVVPGGTISVQINFRNPKKSTIETIRAALIQHRRVAQSCDLATIFQQELLDFREFKGTTLQKAFDLVVPSVHLLPTYTYTYVLPDVDAQIVIAVRYELVLDVKTHGLSTDFRISVPVVVGTEMVSNEEGQRQQQLLTSYLINNPINVVRPTAPISDDYEPPPSYDTVIASAKI